MGALKVGDFVEFFQTFRGQPIPPGAQVSLGLIYQVASLAETHDGTGEIPGIRLVGKSPRASCGCESCRGCRPGAVYPAECFRRVFRPKKHHVAVLKAALLHEGEPT